eukprot:229761_1
MDNLYHTMRLIDGTIWIKQSLKVVNRIEKCSTELINEIMNTHSIIKSDSHLVPQTFNEITITRYLENKDDKKENNHSKFLVKPRQSSVKCLIKSFETIAKESNAQTTTNNIDPIMNECSKVIIDIINAVLGEGIHCDNEMNSERFSNENKNLEKIIDIPFEESEETFISHHLTTSVILDLEDEVENLQLVIENKDSIINDLQHRLSDLEHTPKQSNESILTNDKSIQVKIENKRLQERIKLLEQQNKGLKEERDSEIKQICQRMINLYQHISDDESE